MVPDIRFLDGQSRTFRPYLYQAQLLKDRMIAPIIVNLSNCLDFYTLRI
jgi:hypothetical protein